MFQFSIFQRATEAVDYVRHRLPESLSRPGTGIVCGSGLGGLAGAVDLAPRVEIDYKDIPHFPQSTVPGHAGKLLFGFLGGNKHPVVLMVGRVHFFEGHSIQDVTFPARVLKLLDIEKLIVTNASGGLNPAYSVGDLVVISDHLNIPGLAGIHPLRGPNLDTFGVRFPPLSDAYDLPLRRMVHSKWIEAGLGKNGRRIHEGIYAFVSGPSYETRAECRMLRAMGADLVGMSTVPEIIVARHCGLRVLAISLVTNQAVLDAAPAGNDPAIQALEHSDLHSLDAKGKADHQEVLEAGRLAAADMQHLVSLVVESFETERF